MKLLKGLFPLLVIALLHSGNTTCAQNFILPDIDFEAFEQEALEAVQKLPRKGGFKKKEVYNHLYVFAAQMRQDVDWSTIKNQADFIRAIDIQTPVLFDGYQAPTNIYADYIYDSKGKMRWIYADGKATKVDLTETGNSPQNFLVEVARLQYQMVFVIKEFLPQKAFFGIKDGVAYMSYHLIWEAYDTYSIQESIDLQKLEKIATGNKIAMKMSGVEQEPNTTQAQYSTPSIMPTFMGGGLEMFREWFTKEFTSQIPDNTSISAQMVLDFAVGKDGNIEFVKIVHTNNIELSKIAVDIIKCSPQWSPGMHEGEAVRVYYRLPIEIKTKHTSEIEPSKI